MAEAKYIEAIGRRKTAIARVRLTPAAKDNTMTVNGRELTEFFSTDTLQNMATEALSELKEKYAVSAKVLGGGISSQAEAIRLGVARALVKEDGERRGDLKAAGFLKRDPRAVERKKPGLRKARRRPQWSKR